MGSPCTSLLGRGGEAHLSSNLLAYTSQLLVAMGGILSFFFPWEDTGPDNREETDVKQVDDKEVDDEKTEVEEKVEVPAATVIVSKVTEEAMEEADYELVEKNDDSSTSLSAFPRTPQNSFASLPSLPTGQVDDGFEVITQGKTESESTTALDIASVAAVAKSEDITNNETEVEASPIANLKSGVEALLTDLSAAGPQEEEDSTNKSGLEMEEEEENTTKAETTSNKEENASSSANVEQVQVQSIGEVQDDQEET